MHLAPVPTLTRDIIRWYLKFSSSLVKTRNTLLYSHFCPYLHIFITLAGNLSQAWSIYIYVYTVCLGKILIFKKQFLCLSPLLMLNYPFWMVHRFFFPNIFRIWGKSYGWFFLMMFSEECFIRKFWKIIVIINLSEKLEKIKCLLYNYFLLVHVVISNFSVIINLQI